MTLACPMCGGPLLFSAEAEGAEFVVEMTTDAREHLARCWQRKPLWMTCSVTGCTWRVEFAGPSQDWDGYVLGVSEGATHMRTVHDNEPAASQIERWLLDQARQAGRAVEGHRA